MIANLAKRLFRESKEKGIAFPQQVLTHISTYPLQLAKKALEKETKEAKQAADHSDKWSSCVHDVQDKGQDVDPYAVCTTSVGHQSEVLKSGIKLNPKDNHCEADSGSSNVAVLRDQKNEAY